MHNKKLLQKVKSDFKRTFNCNKFQPKVTIQRQSQNLDYLINPSFQVVNRPFVLLLEDNAHLFFELMVIFEKFQLVKDMTTQLVVY